MNLEFMDYFNEAFGGFAPHRDQDAAAKLALNALLMDDRVERLLLLLKPGSSIGAIEGDPGWLLERRDSGALPAGYEGWPTNATYRAVIDPEAYALTYPEVFLDEIQFTTLIRQALTAYLSRHPKRSAELRDLCELVGL